MTINIPNIEQTYLQVQALNHQILIGKESREQLNKKIKLVALAVGSLLVAAGLTSIAPFSMTIILGGVAVNLALLGAIIFRLLTLIILIISGHKSQNIRE